MRIYIYIPICFYYFYQVIKKDKARKKFTFQYVSIISNYERRRNVIYRNLHSNMFLLFHKVKEVLIDLDWFTFQYVSIISGSNPIWHIKLVCIYIPICFYYFLLTESRRVPCLYIYIPICFYYFNSPSTTSEVYFAIYIPICFYYFQTSWMNT